MSYPGRSLELFRTIRSRTSATAFDERPAGSRTSASCRRRASPRRGLQDRAAGTGRMASSQDPVRAPEAVQARQTDRRLPHRSRRSGTAGLASGRIRKRMVASLREPSGSRSHERQMVHRRRIAQPRLSSRRAPTCWKSPCTMSMPGGVKGGNREESPSSIGGRTVNSFTCQ